MLSQDAFYRGLTPEESADAASMWVGGVRVCEKENEKSSVLCAWASSVWTGHYPSTHFPAVQTLISTAPTP